MARITTSFKTRSFIYDFDVDGGAVGNIPMGVSFSPNAVIVGGFAAILTNFVGGAGATIGVGYTAAGREDALINAVVLAAFMAGNVVTAGPVNQFLLATEITFNVNIGVNPITAGKMIFVLNVVELPQP